MKNAIIINGTTYELVPHNGTTNNICDTCDLHDLCWDSFDENLCDVLHSAPVNYHYIEQPKQKGGEA